MSDTSDQADQLSEPAIEYLKTLSPVQRAVMETQIRAAIRAQAIEKRIDVMSAPTVAELTDDELREMNERLNTLERPGVATAPDGRVIRSATTRLRPSVLPTACAHMRWAIRDRDQLGWARCDDCQTPILVTTALEALRDRVTSALNMLYARLGEREAPAPVDDRVQAGRLIDPEP